MSLLSLIPGWGPVADAIPWSKIAIIIGIAGGMGIAIWWWRADIKEAAYNEFYKEQVEEQLRQTKLEAENEQKRLQDTIKLQSARIASLMKRNDETRAQIDTIRRSIDSFPKGVEVPPVIKDTIIKLREMKDKPDAK